MHVSSPGFVSDRETDHVHSSQAALSTRFSKESSHVNRRARRVGTRRRTSRVPGLRGPGRDHKLQGVPFSTCTCKVGTLRQTSQNSSDASCSSSVEVYQHLLPLSHAWLKAMLKASTHRLSTENRIWRWDAHAPPKRDWNQNARTETGLCFAEDSGKPA